MVRSRYRYFPCGLHAETQVLHGITNLLAYYHVPMPIVMPCPPGVSHVDNHDCTIRPKWTAKYEAADDCSAEGGSPTPLGANESLVVAITHGAAGQGHVARVVAAALADTDGDVMAAIARQQEAERRMSFSSSARARPLSDSRHPAAVRWLHRSRQGGKARGAAAAMERADEAPPGARLLAGAVGAR